MSKFEFFERGFDETTVLLPGWATDYKVFDTLDLETNYLIPTTFSPFNFKEDLLAVLKRHGLDKISIAGWSMGAFAACEFISGYRDRVDGVMLIGARKRYKKEKLEEIKGALKKNKKAFLYMFYKDCFSKSEKKEYCRFRDNLSKHYIDEISLDNLIEGLDYLSKNEIKTEDLKGTKINLVHGKEDRIAPIKEALELKDRLPAARFTAIDDSGHMPFLKADFKNILKRAEISNG